MVDKCLILPLNYLVDAAKFMLHFVVMVLIDERARKSFGLGVGLSLLFLETQVLHYIEAAVAIAIYCVILVQVWSYFRLECEDWLAGHFSGLVYLRPLDLHIVHKFCGFVAVKFADCYEVDFEGGADTHLTFDGHVAAHFFDNLLADTQSETSSAFVDSLVLLKALEIQK